MLRPLIAFTAILLVVLRLGDAPCGCAAHNGWVEAFTGGHAEPNGHEHGAPSEHGHDSRDDDSRDDDSRRCDHGCECHGEQETQLASRVTLPTTCASLRIAAVVDRPAGWPIRSPAFAAEAPPPDRPVEFGALLI